MWVSTNPKNIVKIRHCYILRLFNCLNHRGLMLQQQNKGSREIVCIRKRCNTNEKIAKKKIVAVHAVFGRLLITGRSWIYPLNNIGRHYCPYLVIPTSGGRIWVIRAHMLLSLFAISVCNIKKFGKLSEHKWRVDFWKSPVRPPSTIEWKKRASTCLCISTFSP